MTPENIAATEEESGEDCADSFRLLPGEKPRRIEPEVLDAKVKGDRATVGLRSSPASHSLVALERVDGRWLAAGAPFSTSTSAG